MNMPRFNAEFALSEPVRSHRPASVLEAATDKTVVSPQQTLIPPGALDFTCSPPCTFGPPISQTCCAQFCIFGLFCFPICYTQMAPPCPT